MRVVSASDRRRIDRLLAHDAARRPDVERAAERIVRDVRREGDAAVVRWARKLDALDGPIELRRADLDAGWRATPQDVRRAIRVAATHIERVAMRQVPREFSVTVCPGVRVSQKAQALARVGCYVPGGRYPLPSTLLMTVVPARVAGVADVSVVCPRPAPAVLAAALEAGATRVLRIGGAHAIAALAYGTRSINAVDKIVGPGNAWVAAAKRLVSADCAIDFHAGPSEIVVLATNGRADWIAADLVAQAEHDPAVRPIVVTTSAALARRIAAAVTAIVPRRGPANEAIRRNGAIVVARSRADAVALVNRIAPEHLVCERDSDVSAFRTAGTIFVGRWSAQAAGDYCTGSNHVLPTGGAARFRGGLSAADFVRVFTVQRVTREGLRRIGPPAIALAEAEGLTAHAASLRTRLEEIGASRNR
jgi:histidinol dehydrogenase